MRDNLEKMINLDLRLIEVCLSKGMEYSISHFKILKWSYLVSSGKKYMTILYWSFNTAGVSEETDD